MAAELFDELNRTTSGTLVPTGALLFRRDEPPESAYVVRRGGIALLWPDAKESVTMELLGPNSIIGLPAAMNGAYSVTAWAVTDSEVGGHRRGPRC